MTSVYQQGDTRKRLENLIENTENFKNLLDSLQQKHVNLKVSPIKPEINVVPPKMSSPIPKLQGAS